MNTPQVSGDMLVKLALAAGVAYMLYSVTKAIKSEISGAGDAVGSVLADSWDWTKNKVSDAADYANPFSPTGLAQTTNAGAKADFESFINGLSSLGKTNEGGATGSW